MTRPGVLGGIPDEGCFFVLQVIGRLNRVSVL